MLIDRQVPRKPRLFGGFKGHNKDETSFPGSPRLVAVELQYFALVISLKLFRSESHHFFDRFHV